MILPVLIFSHGYIIICSCQRWVYDCYFCLTKQDFYEDILINCLKRKLVQMTNTAENKCYWTHTHTNGYAHRYAGQNTNQSFERRNGH